MLSVEPLWLNKSLDDQSLNEMKKKRNLIIHLRGSRKKKKKRKKDRQKKKERVSL